MSTTPAGTTGRRVARNTAALLTARGAGLAVSFLFGVYVVRTLGVEEFGRFSLLTATYVLLTIAIHLGLESLLVRQISRDREEAGRYLKAALRLKLTAGLLCLAALAAGPALLHPARPLALPLMLLGVALVLDAVSDPVSIVFQAFERFSIPAGLGLTGGLLYAAFGSAAVYRGGGARELIVAMVAAKAVQAGLAWALAWRAGLASDLRPGVDWRLCGRLLRAGTPFLVSKLFYLIYFRIDMLMLDAMAGERAVGLYGASYKFVNLASTGAAAFTAALFPVMTAAAGRIEMLFRDSLRYLLVTGVGISCLCAVLAEDLLRFLFTDRYAAAAPALTLLAWAVAPVFANLIFSNALLSLDRERWAVPVGAAAVAVNVVLNLLWIPRHREVGAAGATLAAELAVLALYALLLLGGRRLTVPVRELAGIGAAGAALWLVLTLLRGLSWPLAALAGLLVYAAALWLLRVLRGSDLGRLGRALRPGEGAA